MLAFEDFLFTVLEFAFVFVAALPSWTDSFFMHHVLS